MLKITEEMEGILKSSMWVLATADAEGMPNAVPIHFKKILPDNQLLLVDNFMQKTKDNILSNPQVSISVWKDSTGYQFKGFARIETSGEYFETAVKMVEGKMPTPPKGAVVVNLTSIYYTTPGPKAGTRIA